MKNMKVENVIVIGVIINVVINVQVSVVAVGDVQLQNSGIEHKQNQA